MVWNRINPKTRGQGKTKAQGKTRDQKQNRLEAAFGFVTETPLVHLISPEGVPIQANRVSPFARLGAMILDGVIQIGTIALVTWALFLWVVAWPGVQGAYLLIILWLLFWTFMRLPYFILMEYYLRGQTIGKRVVGIRVVDEAGGRLRISSLIVRNMSRDVEFTLPLMYLMFQESDSLFSLLPVAWVLFVLIFPFTNRDRKRLGDMLAGTVVVRVDKPTLLADIAAREVRLNFTFTPAQLAAYGEFEVQVLQRLLAQDKKTTKDLYPIAKAIVTKIGYRKAVPTAQVQEFLTAFYQAQRKYLEERMLVGKRKANKYDAGNKADQAADQTHQGK